MNKTIKYPDFNGSISINQKQITRYYRGDLTLIPDNKKIKLLLKLPLHHYVSRVVAAEMGELLHPEAIKAFYLVVKHYTIHHLKRHKGHDFCDFTHCQLFYGDLKWRKKIEKIVEPVKDHWMLYKGRPVETFFNAICGPNRADPETIWGRSIPYITGGDNRFQGSPLAKSSPNYRWDFKIKKKQFFQKTTIKKIRLIHDRYGYVKAVKSDQKSYTGEGFRRMIGHRFRWNKLKSNHFTLKTDRNFFHFSGYGFGHGVGFCIEEAGELAQYGLTYQEILKFFFKEIDIVPGV